MKLGRPSILLVLVIGLFFITTTVSADYTLQIQALTNSPGDAATNYIGNMPVAPTVTTSDRNRVYVPSAGTITKAEIYDFSDTAGTAEVYKYYIRKNNGQYWLINQTTISAQERRFMNHSLSIPVVQGDYFEIMRIHPTWATNPLTNIVGGYILINTTTHGYALYGMALTNTPPGITPQYLGGRPIAPSTTAGTNKIMIPASGQVTSAYIHDFSGTAGTVDQYIYAIESQSGNRQTIATLSANSAQQRLFNNTGLSLNVYKGGWVEFRRNITRWTVAAATNTVGAVAYVDMTNSNDLAGFPLWVMALTSSPVDNQPIYFGNLPKVPQTTQKTSKVWMPMTAIVRSIELYVYSGTAGTDQEWRMYANLSGGKNYLISAVNTSLAERVYKNTSINIPVTPSDYIEIMAVNPSNWITNPATTIAGGYLWVEYEAATGGSCPECPACPLNLTARFTQNITSNSLPLPVAFNDTSSAWTSAWNWTFGDIGNGNTSTLQHPVHVYTAPGKYNVTLNATYAGLTSWNNQTFLINATYPVLEARFNTTNTSGSNGLSVTFLDTTVGTSAWTSAWNWTFGDGNTSTSQNPTKTYSYPGLFNITMNVTNALGQVSWNNRSFLINITYPVVCDTSCPVCPSNLTARFTQNITSGAAPLIVAFTDGTFGLPSGWNWTFGDGNTSTSQNPTKTYSYPGRFNVTMNATYAGQISWFNQTFLINGTYQPVCTSCPSPTPIANFSAGATSVVIPGNSTQFIDTSQNWTISTGWNWTFGDGSTSQVRDPVYLYANAGVYHVNMSIINQYGSSMINRTNLINVSKAQTPIIETTVPLCSRFSLDAACGENGLTVAFTDQSLGMPLGWNWTFGDGNTSTSQNPTKTYSYPGKFTVNLTATNGTRIESFGVSNLVNITYAATGGSCPTPTPTPTPGNCYGYWCYI